MNETLFKRSLARLTLSAPPPLLRAVGGVPWVADGHELDPQVQLIDRLARVLREPPLHALSVVEARRVFLRQCEIVDVAPLASVRLEDRSIDGPGGPLRLRLYRPEGLPARAPTMLYFHGGGFVVGSVRSHDHLARQMAHEARCSVVSVDYRLAPEHAFPAAVDDALAAYQWALAQREALGTTALGVAGDSAGGCLAAVVCQQARERGWTQPALQFLIYPVTDVEATEGSRQTFAAGPFLERDTIEWFTRQYLPRVAERRDPRASPLRAARLDALAPALVVVAGFDALRDEGRRYAARLREAGVPVDERCADTLPHGFWSMGGVIDAARRQVLALSRLVGERLRAAPP